MAVAAGRPRKKAMPAKLKGSLHVPMPDVICDRSGIVRIRGRMLLYNLPLIDGVID
jgi:hypothetical protein